MDSQKQSAIDRIKQANNILVTVSANPSVDQLAACLGLTLMLNGLGKHAAAVFSGEVPSTIEFLEPEKTIEKNTDSLRDFIISLDKAKADKLRYKVEDKVVKIFITPYKTSISEKDFDFSQGDFNVEVVVALGVHEQKDLDQAITAHGRILHDATVIAVNTTPGNNLGTINWQDETASSLSEMVTSLSAGFEDKDKKVIDNQIATALLTGIVAETDRFSNARTTPDTMKVSAQLMAAGANQQLVSTKLQEPPPEPPKAPEEPKEPPENPPENPGPPLPPAPEEPPKKPNDGSLYIDHDQDKGNKKEPEQSHGELLLPPLPTPTEFAEKRAEEEAEKPEESDQEALPELEKKPESEEARPEIHIDEQGHVLPLGENREFLSGPGPTDEAGVLPAMNDDDEEKPSGAPRDNSHADFTTSPTPDDVHGANSEPRHLEPSAASLPTAHPSGSLLAHGKQASNDGAKDNQPSDVSASKANPPSDAPNDASLPSIKPGATTTIPDFKLPEPSTLPAPTVTSQPAGVDKPVVVAPLGADVDTTDAVPLSVPAEPNDAGGALSRPDVGNARDAVADAINAAGGQDAEPDPIAAQNAAPLGDNLHDTQPADKAAAQPPAATPPATSLAEPLTDRDAHESAPVSASPSDKPLDMPLPPAMTSNPSAPSPAAGDNSNPSAPPPVPPPMMPLISPVDE